MARLSPYFGLTSPIDHSAGGTLCVNLSKFPLTQTYLSGMLRLPAMFKVTIQRLDQIDSCGQNVCFRSERAD
jgi:hypothetical protein